MNRLYAAALVALLPLTAQAEPLVRPGTCELIVASRQSLNEARAYARGISDKQFVKIFRASNSWYAISVGSLKPHEEDQVLSQWKASGRIPQDSYCSKGTTYVAEYDWSSGNRVKQEASATVVTARPQQSGQNSTADKDGNPLITPGICRLIFIETSSIEEAAQAVQAYQKKEGVANYSYGVYRLKTGNFIGANTLKSYFRNPTKWIKDNQRDGYQGRASWIARYVRDGRYPNTARCTDGRDIAQDTGVRMEDNKPIKGLDLVGIIADTFRGGGSGSSIAPSPAQEVENKPRGVSMDGDGWVSVDGRTLGRVSFSYGKYRITCSSGYNSGWGTGSAWGSSFEIEARNRDQAAGVLLQACKR